MVERNFILDRLRSKRTTIDEFNYDKLDAPPISAYFSPFDIAQLNQIAKSLKYSARPKEKYEAIDKIMRSRGFQKIAAGTNRICYRCLEDNRFVAKVAYDAVGISDNPREFRNQFLLKPFVTKIFEVTPCGTLAFAERVNPITSREEYLSIAEDVFEMINEWFIGKYVMEDIGTNYFMNIAVRPGFGPVLLDFPYLYELDGNKLYCIAPDINSPSGCCDGEIDYDAGFNKLLCKKCGAHYKAVELSKNIEDNKIIIKSQGDIRMKVSLKGGSNNSTKSVTTGEFADHAKSIPNSSGMKISLKGGFNKSEDSYEDVDTIEESTPYVEEIYTVNGDAPVVDDPEEEEVETAVDEVVEESIEEATEDIEEEVEEVSEEVKPMVSPIIFAPEEKSDDTVRFYELVKELAEMAHNCEKYGLDRNIVRDTLSESFGDDVEPAKAADPLDTINEYLMDYAADVDEEVVVDVLTFWLENRYLITANECNAVTFDPEHEVLMFDINPIVQTAEFGDPDEETDFVPEIIYKENVGFNLCYPFKDVVAQLAEVGWKVVEVDSSNSAFEYGIPKYYSGSIEKLAEIFVDNEDEDSVILIKDENGNYLTTGEDNNIIVIDTIDGKAVNEIEVVSKEWLNNSVITNAVCKAGILPPTNNGEANED